eukprot:scaffold102664_cov32-Tisochrysis_lutea.AAC.1
MPLEWASKFANSRSTFSNGDTRAGAQPSPLLPSPARAPLGPSPPLPPRLAAAALTDRLAGGCSPAFDVAVANAALANMTGLAARGRLSRLGSRFSRSPSDESSPAKTPSIPPPSSSELDDIPTRGAARGERRAQVGAALAPHNDRQ